MKTGGTKTATKCFICGEDFKEGDKKCRDHCHFTGKYRGCAHDDCNLQFSMRYYKIPVFLHNLKNYDSHLVIERANELSENAKIDVIAPNSEKFITFAFKNMCFKDSFSFLSSSLDKLVKLSKYEDGQKKENWQNNFKFSKRNPYVSNDNDLDLLTDKGVYPYDYFTSLEKEDEEIRDFVRCHPVPSPDDEEGDKFWKKVIDRLKNDQGLNAMIIYSFVIFDIVKKMYENLTDKKVIVDYGKELNRDGKWMLWQ